MSQCFITNWVGVRNLGNSIEVRVGVRNLGLGTCTWDLVTGWITPESRNTFLEVILRRTFFEVDRNTFIGDIQSRNSFIEDIFRNISIGDTFKSSCVRVTSRSSRIGVIFRIHFFEVIFKNSSIEVIIKSSCIIFRNISFGVTTALPSRGGNCPSLGYCNHNFLVSG